MFTMMLAMLYGKHSCRHGSCMCDYKGEHAKPAQTCNGLSLPRGPPQPPPPPTNTLSSLSSIASLERPIQARVLIHMQKHYAHTTARVHEAGSPRGDTVVARPSSSSIHRLVSLLCLACSPSSSSLLLKDLPASVRRTCGPPSRRPCAASSTGPASCPMPPNAMDSRP